MLVKVVETVKDISEIELEVNTLREILNGLQLSYGKEFIEKLHKEQYKYILLPENEAEEAVTLIPEVLASSLLGYSTLIIIRDIDGNLPVAVVAEALAVAETSFAAIAATALINMGLSMALSSLMAALSPSKEFSKDPAQAQTLESNLFNGGPPVKEQGGVVPIIMGTPYCTGVLISSGISTEDF